MTEQDIAILLTLMLRAKGQTSVMEQDILNLLTFMLRANVTEMCDRTGHA